MTEVQPLKLTVGGEQVSAELTAPANMTSLMTLAHGAGAGMNHAFMVALAKELANRSIGTLRFNFLYMEKKKGRPDLPPVAHQAVEAALHKARELFPNVPLFAAGKSFGGRMSSQYVAKAKPDFVKGLVFFGFPLHPVGKPGVERAEHLKEIAVPMLFLQGTRDDLALWELIEPTCKALPLATLARIEGADHSFKIPKQNAMPLLCDGVQDWIAAGKRS